MRIQPFTRFLRLLSATLVLILAIYGLYMLFRGGPGSDGGQTIETTALNPISRGEILSEFRLITVERQYRIPVVGRSYKPMPDESSGIVGQIATDLFGNRKSVPGTTTELVYEMVTTVTMGIDLAKIKDSDIANGEQITTLTLPRPEVLAVVHDPAQSRIFAKDTPALPYLDNSASLLEELQRTGTAKHRAEANNDDALLAKAENEARRSLKNLLEKIHPGREVHILFKPEKKDLPPE